MTADQTDVINMGEAARWYASGGWRVFPVAPRAKLPLTANGYKDATADPQIITDWWSRWPDANIGLACGPSGLIALDADPAHYTDESRALLGKLLGDCATAAQTTPSGGTHLLYRLPSDVELNNSPRGLPPGFDVRVNGYILLAPSLVEYHGDEAKAKKVEDGRAGRYAWLPGRDPYRYYPRALPDEILELLRAPERRTALPIHVNGAGGGNKAYGAAALGKELDTLARTPEGSRNNQLNTAAFNLGQLVAGGELDESEVRDKLTDTAVAIGLDEHEAARTVDSGLGAGMLKPRNAPPWAEPKITFGGAGADADADTEPLELHPLDTEAAQGLRLGRWLDRYTETMTHLTGSPMEFNRLAGLTAAATVLQGKARLRMSFGNIYPNIYACMVAPSSVYHKTATLAKVRATLERALLFNLMLSELQTSEGLLAELQGQPSGVILRDEIGALFDSGRTKYLRNLKPDLTALYDCYPYRRRLSAVEIKVERPYLNILGATTPDRFYDGVSPMDWRDGFLPRWLFVMPTSEPDFDAMTGLLSAQHDQTIGELAVHLNKLSRQDETDFVFTGDAHSLWDTWQRRAAKDAYYFGDDTAAAIVTRYSAYALKFAMILAALDGEWGRITPETMRTAIALADDYKRHAYRLLTERQEHQVSGGRLQKVFLVIKSEGQKSGGWMSARDILRAAHMRKTQLDPCLEKLVEVGAIVQEKAGRGYKYAAVAENLPVKSWK